MDKIDSQNRSQDLIDGLENRLYDLAGEWRRLHSLSFYENAEDIVKEYHRIMDELWSLGWDGEGLSPTAELPERLMPNYFLERWKSS